MVMPCVSWKPSAPRTVPCLPKHESIENMLLRGRSDHRLEVTSDPDDAPAGLAKLYQ
jgi:hypothetical protein